MHVLVTGGLGFIGYAVARALDAAGHDVTVLARASSRARPLPAAVEIVRADITDIGTLRSAFDGRAFDGVCHLAALARVRESFERPLEYFETNVGGTANLLRALADAGSSPSAFVLASTGAVYGSNASGTLSEDQPASPDTPYAASKRAAEQLVEYHAKAGAIGACILRSFSVAGAVNGVTDDDETRIISSAVRVAAGLRETIKVNGDGTVVREFTHVVDVAAAYVRAIEVTRLRDVRVYNVGTGTGVTMNDVISAVAAVASRPVPTEHLPARNEPHELIADTTRIRAELGWSAPSSELTQVIGDAWRARRR